MHSKTLPIRLALPGPHRAGLALGAACIVETEQLCLLLGEDRRGDERVVTQAFPGCFRDRDQMRNEFLLGGAESDVR